MTTPLLSIDILPACLRVACVRKTWKRIVVDHSLRVDIDPEQEIASRVDQLEEQLRTAHIVCDQAVLTFSDSHALIQPLHFPFHDLKKIRNVAAYELENRLSLQISDYAWDVLPLASEHRGEQSVLAILYPRDRLQAWVRSLEDKGIHVHQVGVTHGSLIHWVQSLRFSDQPGPAVLFVDHTITSLVWFAGKHLLGHRCLPLGTDRICLGEEDTALPFQSGFPNPSCAQCSDPSALSDLVQDLRMTLVSAETEAPPRTVAVFQADPECPALAAALCEGLDAKAYSLAEKDDPMGMLMQCPSSHFPAFLAAWGYLGSGRGLDLLQGDMHGKKDIPILGPHLGYLLWAALAIALCGCTVVGLDIYFLHSRLTTLDHRLKTTFEHIISDAPANIQPLQYASVITSRIQDLERDKKNSGDHKVSASQVLETVSTSLPKDMDVQISLFALDGLDLRLHGQARDFRTVDLIKNLLEQEDMVHRVTILGANVDQGAGVGFRLRLELRAVHWSEASGLISAGERA